MESNEKPQQTLFRQTLFRQTKVLPFTSRYILSDNAGLYITFHTAQQAFSWIEMYTPAVITNVKIEQ